MQSLSYTLTGTTLTVRAQSGKKPYFDRTMTIVLLSSAVSRKLQLKFSPDAGWTDITPTYTETGQLTLSVSTPIYDIKATGVADDVLQIVQ